MTAEVPKTASLTGRLRRSVSRSWIIPLAAIALGTLVRIPQLFHTLNEMHAFRQTQTALLARNYAEQGFTLAHSPLTVFGATSDVPMEFPAVQGVGALLIKAGLPSDFAMRTIGLVSFEITAALLVVLLLRWHGTRVAAIAVILLEFSPYGLAWGAASLIEFSAVALSLTMVIALDRWFTGGRWWWLALGVVGSWLAFLVKVTTAPVWGVLVVASAVAVLLQFGWRARWRRVLVGAVAAPGVGLGLAVAWAHFADGVKADNPLTVFLTSSSLTSWNFGTAAQRLDFDTYLVIAGRVTDEMAGPLAVTLLLGVVAGIVGHGAANRVRRLSWAVAAAIGPLVFLNLYFVHNYYLCAVVVGVVVVIAQGIDGLGRFLERWARKHRQGVVRALVAVVVTVLVLISTALSPLGRLDLRQWLIGNPEPPAAIGIDQVTKPSDRIVMVGCDWDPTIAYYAHRVVVMFRGTDSADFWKREQPANYGYVYNCGSVADLKPYLVRGATVTATAVTGLSRIVLPRK